MNPEFSNSYDNSTERKTTTLQGTENLGQNATDKSEQAKADAEKQKELKKQQEQEENQKLIDQLNVLKTDFPGLESLFPSKNNELLTQLKTPEVQNLLQTLDNFAKNFMNDKEVNQKKLFDTRKLLYPELINTEYDPRNIPTGIKNIIETIKKLQNPKLNNFDRSILTTWIAWIQFILKMETFENSRAILNENRINQKIHTLASKLTWKDAWKLTESDLTQINAKKKSVGNLTFEACIDDYLAEKFTVSEGATIDQIYEAREQYSIDQLSNNSPERFHTAILTSSQNNQGIKLDSFKQIKDFSDENSIKIANDQANLKSKETNGFLNRQELIISALKGSRSPQETNKILQVIGQVYYNNKSIKVDGIRWKQTNTIAKQLLEDFKDNQKFIDNGVIRKLQQILKTRPKYNTSIIERSLKDRMQASVFDTQKTTAYYKAHPEENPLLKNANNSVKSTGAEYKKSQQERQATVELTKGSFNDIDDSTIDNMIPEDELIKSAWAFVDRLIKQGAIKIEDKQEKNSDSESNSEEEDQNFLSFPTKKSAIETVLTWETSTKKLEALNKARESSPEKVQLFSAQKELLTQTLKISAKETVVRAGTDFLRKMGVQLEGSQKLITLNNWVHYYEFSSTDGIKYYYRPDTWNISTPNLNSIDHNQKELKLWFQGKYTILHHIPSYAQLTEQAQNLSFLNTEKPKSNEELSKIIKNGMQSNIDLSVWELETDAVKEIIQKENTKTKIAQDIINTFNSDQNLNLKQEENPLLYQTLQSLLNTLNTPRLSTSQVQTLHKFTKFLKEQFNLSRTNQQKINANPETMTSLSQIQLKTPQELFALISNHLEIQKLKDPTQRKREEKSEFWISILLKFLEKNIPGESSEFNIIDIKKLEPLINNMTDPNILKKPEYSKLISSIKNLYPRVIEANARKKEEFELNALEQQFSS